MRRHRPTGSDGQRELLRPCWPRSRIPDCGGQGEGRRLPFPLPPLSPSSALAAFNSRSLIQLDRGRPSCSAALWNSSLSPSARRSSRREVLMTFSIRTGYGICPKDSRPHPLTRPYIVRTMHVDREQPWTPLPPSRPLPPAAPAAAGRSVGGRTARAILGTAARRATLPSPSSRPGRSAPCGLARRGRR